MESYRYSYCVFSAGCRVKGLGCRVWWGYSSVFDWVVRVVWLVVFVWILGVKSVVIFVWILRGYKCVIFGFRDQEAHFY